GHFGRCPGAVAIVPPMEEDGARGQRGPNARAGMLVQAQQPPAVIVSPERRASIRLGDIHQVVKQAPQSLMDSRFDPSTIQLSDNAQVEAESRRVAVVIGGLLEGGATVLRDSPTP